mgnify:CR=1 FL=1
MGKRLVILLVLVGLPVVSFAGDVEDKEAANSVEEAESPKVEYRERLSFELGVGAITTTADNRCVDDGDLWGSNQALSFMANTSANEPPSPFT